jgi:hypothetical protein
MRIDVLNDDIKLNFAKALFANELNSKFSDIYRFSDAKTGKSGYSFGITQLDINNSSNALLALKEMNFTTDEVTGLRAKKIPLDPMNAKLMANKDVVDKWDRFQMSECLSWPLLLCNEIGVDLSSTETFLHIADYHNQFNFSRGGKMYLWLKTMKQPVTPEMIRDFKYTTLYGKQYPDDVLRRYQNIVNIVRG